MSAMLAHTTNSRLLVPLVPAVRSTATRHIARPTESSLSLGGVLGKSPV